MSDLVLRKDKDGLATLTLNRPEKLNALTVQMFVELLDHVKNLEKETDHIGAVVIRGAGKCFSAGNDLNDLATGVALPRPNLQAYTIHCLANLPQPVISAVHGHCYTGALELALAGDLILAAESSRFADTHATWALTPIWGMSQRLPRRVGTAKAREMMFLGRTYSGIEAEAMGLVNFCVSEDVFDSELELVTRTILDRSWFSHRANKQLLAKTDGLPVDAGLAYEVFYTQGKGPDVQERINAFKK